MVGLHAAAVAAYSVIVLLYLPVLAVDSFHATLGSIACASC